MRSFVVLALCLGLAAVAYAQDVNALDVEALEEVSLPPTSVLLTGLVADEDMFKGETNSSSALNGHYRHWHRHGPRHDPEDHHYWERRHSAKAELLKCIYYAVDLFDIDNSRTWKRAGKTLAHCFFEHLNHCHDVPKLGDDITSTLPWLLAVQGLDALVAGGPSGLEHARLVFQFYLVGAKPAEASNPFYNADGCASRLTALLQSGCQKADQTAIWALAKLVAKFLETATSGGADDLGLGNCVADIPAVLLSLFSTGCPQRGYLYNPLATAPADIVPCTVNPNKFEDSPAALLGGSIYTLLLLSDKPKLVQLGVQVAFAANRFAVAATQTTDIVNTVPGWVECLGSDLKNGGGQLSTLLSAVPKFSGVLGGQQAATPLPLSADGQRVLCLTLGMMAGKPGATDYAWNPNLFWQGAADIANAIFKTIATKPGSASIPQIELLCGAARAIWTFAPVQNPSAGQEVVTVPGAVTPQQDFKCMTDSSPSSCGTLPWGFLREPLLADNHDLASTSYIGQYCWNGGVGRKLML